MSETTAVAVAALRAAYPRQDFPDESVRMYVRMLADLDPTLVSAAVHRLVNRSAWLPAVSEIRLEVAEETCPLPTAAEAWTMTVEPMPFRPVELPIEVRETIRALGGTYTIVHSERPETIRAQFLKDYQQRRDTAMLESIGGRAPRPQLTRAERAFGGVIEPSYPALPESEAIRPRPVWARWLRRQASLVSGALIDPWPTDEEKHDAILVLRSAVEQGDDVLPKVSDELHREAQRIMDEASAATAIDAALAATSEEGEA
jgi:hypothetical protein